MVRRISNTRERNGNRELRRDLLGHFVMARIEQSLGLGRGSLAQPGKSSMTVSSARGRSAYVLHTVCGLSLTQVAVCMRQHRSSVSNAVARIESDRDDPVLDAHIQKLEDEVTPLMDVLDQVLEVSP